MSALWHIGRGDKKLITAIVPAGQGEPLMTRLESEPGVLAVTHHHARGVGRRRVEPGRLISDEKDVVLVLAETENADDVFGLIYREGRLSEPHVGLIFMEKVLRGHPMLPFATESDDTA